MAQSSGAGTASSGSYSSSASSSGGSRSGGAYGGGGGYDGARGGGSYGRAPGYSAPRGYAAGSNYGALISFYPSGNPALIATYGGSQGRPGLTRGTVGSAPQGKDPYQTRTTFSARELLERAIAGLYGAQQQGQLSSPYNNTKGALLSGYKPLGGRGQDNNQEFYKQGTIEHKCPTCGGFSLFGAACVKCKMRG